MWIGELCLGRSLYVTLEKEEDNMEVGCTFIIAMEMVDGFLCLFVDVFCSFKI